MTRSALTMGEIIFLTRLIGHHTTGGGRLEVIYNVLANKCKSMGIDHLDLNPLALEIPPKHPHGNRVLLREIGQ